MRVSPLSPLKPAFSGLERRSNLTVPPTAQPHFGRLSANPTGFLKGLPILLALSLPAVVPAQNDTAFAQNALGSALNGNGGLRPNMPTAGPSSLIFRDSLTAYPAAPYRWVVNMAKAMNAPFDQTDVLPGPPDGNPDNVSDNTQQFFQYSFTPNPDENEFEQIGQVSNWLQTGTLAPGGTVHPITAEAADIILKRAKAGVDAATLINSLNTVTTKPNNWSKADLEAYVASQRANVLALPIIGAADFVNTPYLSAPDRATARNLFFVKVLAEAMGSSATLTTTQINNIAAQNSGNVILGGGATQGLLNQFSSVSDWEKFSMTVPSGFKVDPSTTTTGSANPFAISTASVIEVSKLLKPRVKKPEESAA